jgi:small-conductance mechanosensitive channel
VNTITNYSRSCGGANEVVVTAVTIGYDVPWRQVHGMLQLAAQRTPEVAPEPAPFVLQQALSDFYVQYLLHVRLVRGSDYLLSLSRLHAAIQDAFNERGVQIMSPHFMTQPGRPVVVPRSAWFAEPAAREGNGNESPAQG